MYSFTECSFAIPDSRQHLVTSSFYRSELSNIFINFQLFRMLSIDIELPNSYFISLTTAFSVSMKIICLCLAGSCGRTSYFDLRIITVFLSTQCSSAKFLAPSNYHLKLQGFRLLSQYLSPKCWKLLKMSGLSIFSKLNSYLGLARAGVPVRRNSLFFCERKGTNCSHREVSGFLRQWASSQMTIQHIANYLVSLAAISQETIMIFALMSQPGLIVPFLTINTCYTLTLPFNHLPTQSFQTYLSALGQITKTGKDSG